MKTITADEFSKLEFLSKTSKYDWLKDEVVKLEIGEAVVIDEEDLLQRVHNTDLSRIKACASNWVKYRKEFENKNFRVRKLADGKSIAILRLQ